MVPPDSPGHLDVPLMWGREVRGSSPSRPPQVQAMEPVRRVHLWEVWIAYLADTGVVLLCVGTAWVLAALGGAGLNPLQIVLAAAVGVEVAMFMITATVWAWRGTPGMLLANLTFGKPLALVDALVVCAVWMLALPFVGVPLLLRRRGVTLAEHLAGADLRSRSPRGDA
jgi:hypothetical protein